MSRTEEGQLRASDRYFSWHVDGVLLNLNMTDRHICRTRITCSAYYNASAKCQWLGIRHLMDRNRVTAASAEAAVQKKYT